MTECCWRTGKSWVSRVVAYWNSFCLGERGTPITKRASLQGRYSSPNWKKCARRVTINSCDDHLTLRTLQTTLASRLVLIQLAMSWILGTVAETMRNLSELLRAFIREIMTSRVLPLFSFSICTCESDSRYYHRENMSNFTSSTRNNLIRARISLLSCLSIISEMPTGKSRSINVYQVRVKLSHFSAFGINQMRRQDQGRNGRNKPLWY